jgi:alkanesulfonate monooxygenase SsuD/methylene tetrahydromethanopterin reductase-like flavin-dependent oxidoreductase (luciferase family)
VTDQLTHEPAAKRRLLESPIPVGARLPLPSSNLGSDGLLAIARTAADLGYSSLWASDHIVLPDRIDSTYPFAQEAVGADGNVHPIAFPTDSVWPDPLLTLAWLKGQLDAPGMLLGTSVLIISLRNPVLLAKQVATLSWLVGEGLLLGVGSGWLQEEYEFTGVPFERRGTRARQVLERTRELLEREEIPFLSATDPKREKQTTVRPRSAGPVRFLWGGYSDYALRIVAESAHGWYPTKLTFEGLATKTEALRRYCDEAGRDFDELQLIIKPGRGPYPDVGAVNADNLARYRDIGMQQAVVELPLQPSSAQECIDILGDIAIKVVG